ncbi:MAG: DUF3467 domain-containing protein [Deltaproteobacteria bacterium]|nr:DUF3467 domain-containing protein [Deltaproteobacteria bacterium]
MAKEREGFEKPAETATPAAPATPGQARIVWDSSNVRSVYANVFNIGPGREEFVIFFGMNQAWDAEQKELKVQLTERVVMSPFAAKRLAMALTGTVAEFEKRFGTIDIEARRMNA